MVETTIISSRNVIDFERYRRVRQGSAFAAALRACRHCGAALSEGDSEDDCSSALNSEAPRRREPPRRFYAE